MIAFVPAQSIYSHIPIETRQVQGSYNNTPYSGSLSWVSAPVLTYNPSTSTFQGISNNHQPFSATYDSSTDTWTVSYVAKDPNTGAPTKYTVQGDPSVSYSPEESFTITLSDGETYEAVYDSGSNTWVRSNPDVASGSLSITKDENSGNVTQIRGTTDTNEAFGLVYDPNNNTWYGKTQHQEPFYITEDPSTGTWTVHKLYGASYQGDQGARVGYVSGNLFGNSYEIVYVPPGLTTKYPSGLIATNNQSIQGQLNSDGSTTYTGTTAFNPRRPLSGSPFAMTIYPNDTFTYQTTDTSGAYTKELQISGTLGDPSTYSYQYTYTTPDGGKVQVTGDQSVSVYNPSSNTWTPVAVYDPSQGWALERNANTTE
jgi:hypothetical protein